MAKTRTNKNQKTKSQTTLENAFLAPLDPADRLRHEVTSREAKWDIIFLTIVLLVLFIAFTRRAFHIDDPLFIWTARHIQTNPTNPYGFSVNWYGLDMPMWEVAKNPPLVSYYILLAASMLGWSEPALHFAFMVPALAAAIGMYLIARRFCRYPLLAVLAGLLTPVFFVSTLTVMSDMMMLAFFVFAVHFWIKGLDSNSYGCLALAGLLIGISRHSDRNSHMVSMDYRSLVWPGLCCSTQQLTPQKGDLLSAGSLLRRRMSPLPSRVDA